MIDRLGFVLDFVLFAACGPEFKKSDEYQELIAELDQAESGRKECLTPGRRKTEAA